MPAEEKLRLPGAALAAATKSLTVCQGASLRTTSTTGERAMSTTGSKSLTAS